MLIAPEPESVFLLLLLTGIILNYNKAMLQWRVFLVLPYLHENGEVGQYPLIDRVDEIPISKDGGYRISNTLALLEDGPRLVRSFTVEHWGTETPFFQINDHQDIDCEDAIKTYGFEAIISSLVEMLKCQITMDSEYKELQSRIERTDSLMGVMQEKFVIECRQSNNESESETEEVRT